jgi:hypothetical protein
MNKEEFKKMLERYLTVEVEHTTELSGLNRTRINTYVTIKFDGIDICESSDTAEVDTSSYCD